ncbi:UDP-glycosyltransferase 73E1 [Artemisia annua]|uniref:UDP-glycosyltransferase 73E1 n=1 Tax=Artemisia annua TaxID=35608 RepID=A0A2U1Q7C3_ARTAN|nr:UDP-glycosyltransferase 73E1 [Artemisia annua]
MVFGFVGFTEILGVFVWNSILESTYAGVPMVTWPFFADQFFNKIFIVEILKIGVRMSVEIPVPFGEEDMFEVLVKKEDVKTVVECLMQEDEEGKQRKKRAREFGKWRRQQRRKVDLQ